ncbi:uncharacterized protein APUU_12331A [Aspergillus puulaauensis]|uniref:Uncharacterized protein n=1 Tax=Aspergillus puulaauensis TaxID=1220207 RepID=A0A7R7XED0_9EURO|nr:uncharacterized protein APUU_12331A [Aspergillus puulaauensis]BCS19503.1 hypothetical protein APUU_12331A [Aspergillus puulaauensis]
MPTATSTIGWTLANAGPGPATHSVPTWCTESSYQIATATSAYPVWDNQCSTTVGNAECGVRPTDSALAKEATSNWYILPFYSPGPSCPSGWKTVGAVAPSAMVPTAITTTFNASEASDLIPVSAAGPIYLMHKPSDVSNSDSGSGTNAASTLRTSQSDWWRVMGALAVSLTLGMVMVLPW